MLSNFGRADGGRETWAYQFIPRLLAQYPRHRLRIVGFRSAGEPDSEPELRAIVAEADRPRLSIRFLAGPRSRLPNAILFARAMRAEFPRPLPQVRLVIAVGSFVELGAVLASRAFPNAGKLVWLRSIFAAEKAHRYPAVFRRVIESAERQLLRRADRIIANGEDTAAAYRAMGLDVAVIANATELSRWSMDPPRFGTPIHAAFVGRLAPVKGIAEFAAAARLISDGPLRERLRFHVVGDGPERSLVEAAAADGVLIDHGALPNERMPAFLAGMDACVALGIVGSHGGSGTSNAVIEQMAAGRLMICWNNAAYRQLVDEQCAYLVTQGDVYGLLETLQAIVLDPVEACHRATQGQERSRLFGMDRHMILFADVAKRWIAR